MKRLILAVLLSALSFGAMAQTRIGINQLQQIGTNTILGNATAGTANIATQSMPSCSTSASALKWTTSTGFGCNSAIDAATLGGATFANPGTIGSTPGAATFTTLGASGTVTLSGAAANIATGSNYISNGGTDAGLSFDASNNATLSAKVTATGGIVGTATNDSASAGNVGEYVECVVAPASAISLTTTVTANICSISLTAGDWDVSAQAGYSWYNTTNLTQTAASLSTTTATLDQTAGRAAYLAPQFAATANLNISNTIPPYRFSLSSTTTIYLTTVATFSISSFDAFGKLGARRMR